MVSKAIRLKRPKGRNLAHVRVEIAKYLCMRWAPGSELRIVTGVPAATLNHAEEPGPEDIQWCPAQGLTKLLHEIGHYRMSPRRLAVEGNIDRANEVAEEARAWAWAEWCARQEGIWFDHRMANENFETYVHGGKAKVYLPLRIKWRYV